MVEWHNPRLFAHPRRTDTHLLANLSAGALSVLIKKSFYSTGFFFSKIVTNVPTSFEKESSNGQIFLSSIT